MITINFFFNILFNKIISNSLFFQGENLGTTEATETFFAITKLFQVLTVLGICCYCYIHFYCMNTVAVVFITKLLIFPKLFIVIFLIFVAMTDFHCFQAFPDSYFSWTTL